MRTMKAALRIAIPLFALAALSSCADTVFDNPNDPMSATYKWKNAKAPTIAPVEAPAEKLSDTEAETYYYGPLDISITADEGATIRYTIDGTDPVETSPEYSGKLAISASATVKAKAWKDDYLPSEISENAFKVHPILRSWEWETADNAENWVCSGYEKTYKCTNLSVSDGSLHVSYLKTVSDPSLWSQKITGDIDISNAYRVVVRMRHNTACDHCAFYVKTTSTQTNSCIQNKLNATEDMTLYEMDASKWRTYKSITELRFDPLDWGSTAAGNTVDIDYIRLYAE